ncbi:MAG TPA: rod shape-determining protein RodA [Oligoflexia bacterium]|nr:rod shape-determining protein RodA [Oligoflexia bacterium]HMR24807.1 rod shape-determining protein RodA [Oligoflexia bacterium]
MSKYLGKTGRFDWGLFLLVMALLIISLFNLYSATLGLSTAKYFKSQMIWSLLSVMVAAGIALFDYRLWSRYVYPIYGLTLLILLYVLFFGKTSQGAQRWIRIAGVAFQPSELAKISVVLTMAKYYSEKRDFGAMGIVQLIKPILLMLLPFLLVLKQPDLGTALILAGSGVIMTLFVGVEKKIVITTVVLMLASVPLVWKYMLHPYQKDRVVSFLNPEKYPLSKGYQVIQSKIAIGSGQFFGKGYLKGTQSKLQFLPKQHTDFVFSNFAEEFGFMGSFFLIALYTALGVLGFSIALHARDSFGLFLALGTTCLLLTQTIINLGMEIGMLPVVGMTLPILSYGGSSLLTTFVGVGILMNVSLRRYLF